MWVKAWIWCDTDDCVANALTKLNADGTLPLEPLTLLLKLSFWEPLKEYLYNNIRCAPAKLKHIPAIVNMKMTKRVHMIQDKPSLFDLTFDDDQWNPQDEWDNS